MNSLHPEAEASIEQDRLRAFLAVRSLQASVHPSGRPTYCTFISGRCHALAYAVQDLTDGDLVVLTSPDDVGGLVHVGVFMGDLVIDAAGYTPVEEWRERWCCLSNEPHLEIALASRQVVDRAMLNRPAEDLEVVWARPLAEALVAAVDVDVKAWRALLPFGATALVPDTADRMPLRAYLDALARRQSLHAARPVALAIPSP